MTSVETIRAFVALVIDEPMRARIMNIVHDLQSQVLDVRWIKENQAHLTLRFLGDASPESLRMVKEGLLRAASACPATEARFAGLDVFPERGSPRVLWLGVTFSGALFFLQRECERTAVTAGFAPETRGFTPHLTLGRWKTRGLRPKLPAVDLGSSVFSRLILYRSDLKPSGAVHTPLDAFALGSG